VMVFVMRSRFGQVSCDEDVMCVEKGVVRI
jgi:hypothetical protein